MKKLCYTIILIVIILLAFIFKKDIYSFYYDNFVPIEKKVSVLEKNNYYRDYDFKYVQNTTNFIPHNKQEILNIYYTIVNSGMTDFIFFCPKDYDNCSKDISDIAHDQDTISNINNFIHPYNSFKSLQTEVDTLGKVTIKTEKIYDEKSIIILNYKVDEIYNKLIKENDDLTLKIKRIHDYIINNTSYDKERSDKKIIKYESDKAYGVLIEGYGLCSGYTDAMMLFLEKMNIKNAKISTDNHIWNYLYVNDKWLHLDLTWDDPISSNGKNILDDTYFLIDSTKLKEIEKLEHNYNENIYAN